jgi:hypothetical protein
MENFNDGGSGNRPDTQSNLFGSKQTLPNATAVLVLGILSIVTSCFFVGLVLGIIGLVMASKGRSMYRSSPESYEGYSQLNAGWIMSIIGVCIGSLYTLYYIIVIAILGHAYSLSDKFNH